MKKIHTITIILVTLFFTSFNAEAIYAPRSPSPHECGRTLLNNRQCAPWSSLYEVEDTIKDRSGGELRPYRWYSIREKQVKRIVLHGIRFDFDKSNIKPESRPILDENMSELKASKNVDIHIIGHTDYVGTDAYNQALSERRAQAVLNYFVSQGLDSSRVRISGKGESQPIDTNQTDSGRFNNRRIEIEITHQ